MAAVLLPDLVAGWELTSGPQQTMDSSGIVAGGANNGIENGGALVYGADGALFDESVPQFLSVNDSSPFRIGNTSIFVSARVIIASSLVISRFKTIAGCSSATDDDNWMLRYQSPNDLGNMYVEVFADDVDNLLTDSVPYVLMGWFDSDAGNVGFQLNDNVPVIVATTSPPSLDSQLFLIGAMTWGPGLGGWNGTIGQLRFWKGSNALVIANNPTYRSWLANVVGGVAIGRSDAEVAAYTGGGDVGGSGGTAMRMYMFGHG